MGLDALEMTLRQPAVQIEKDKARAKMRITSLENEVDSMRNAQEVLRRKSKDAAKEHEVRVLGLQKEQAALRRDLEESQRRVRQLEADNERQKGMLHKKTEEAARNAREARDARLRTAPASSTGEGDAGSKPLSARGQRQGSAHAAADLVKLKGELDGLMRLVSGRTEAEKKLSTLNSKKEALSRKRDQVAQARNQLELRRMRGQQAVAKHIGEMTLAIQELEEELGPLREQAGAGNSRAAAEVLALEEQLGNASKRRQQLQARLDSQDFLPAEDVAAARDLDDAADALDTELEYIADAADAASKAVAEGAGAAEAFGKKTGELTVSEARSLLAQYMETLVTSRDRDRRAASKVAELEVSGSNTSALMLPEELMARSSCRAAGTMCRASQGGGGGKVPSPPQGDGV